MNSSCWHSTIPFDFASTRQLRDIYSFFSNETREKKNKTMDAKSPENIKHLIPRPKTPVVKPPMHRSVYTESVKRTYRANRDCHRTMGYAEVRLNPPSQFLKKHTRRVTRPFVGKKASVAVCSPYDTSIILCSRQLW